MQMKNQLKISKEVFIKIGILTKTHNFSGKFLLKLNSDFFGKKIAPKWLFFDIEEGLVPFKVLTIKEKDDVSWIVKIDGINSEKTLQQYKGLSVYINPEDISYSTDYENDRNVFELINYTVYDKKYGNLGKVQKIIDIQQNPLISLTYNEKEILIPMQKDFIISFDKNNREIHIKVPEGLIELYL